MKGVISDYRMERYEKWGRKHLKDEHLAFLEYVAFLYEKPDATLASVGKQLHLSGEMIRVHLMDREYALRCESLRIQSIDLSELAPR